MQLSEQMELHLFAKNNILSLFRQIVKKEFEIHLFNLYLADKDNVDFDVYRKQASALEKASLIDSADKLIGNHLHLRQQNETAHLHALEESLSSLRSDLYSLINAVHKSSFLHSVFPIFYPIHLDYYQVKQACFLEARTIFERYEANYFDPLHTETIPTYGTKHQQGSVNFNAQYYFFQLHHYFDLVELNRIVAKPVDVESEFNEKKINQYQFHFCCFPLFWHKNRKLYNHEKIIQNLINAYFNSAEDYLEKNKASFTVQARTNPKKFFKKDKDGCILRPSNEFVSPLIYKLYPITSVDSLIKSDEALDWQKTYSMVSELVSDYDADLHQFSNKDLICFEEVMRTPVSGINFSIQPIQFVFNTQQAYVLYRNEHGLRNHNLYRYTGNYYLLQYLKADRTGFWIDEFLHQYFMILSGTAHEESNAQRLHYLKQFYEQYSINLSFIEVLGLYSIVSFKSIFEDFDENKAQKQPLIWNAFINQQLTHLLMTGDYYRYIKQKDFNQYEKLAPEKDFNHLAKKSMLATLVDNYNKEYSSSAKNQNKTDAVVENVPDMMKNLVLEFKTDSIMQLFDGLYNQPYKTIQDMVQHTKVGVGEAISYPELTLNFVEYRLLFDLMSLSKQHVEKLRENIIDWGLVYTRLLGYEEESSLLKAQNQSLFKEALPENRELKAIKPALVFALSFGEEFSDVHVDHLVFTSGELHPNIHLNIYCFLDKPFTEEEINASAINMKKWYRDKSKVAHISIPLSGQNSLRILNNWKSLSRYLRLSFQYPDVIAGWHHVFNKEELNNEIFQFRYELSSDFDIIVSLNL